MLNKNKEKLIIIAIIISIFLASLFLVTAIIKTLKYRGGKPSDIIYIDNIKASNDYKVYLKNNDYVKEEYLPSNSSYITSLVEYINPDFNYEYSGNNNVSIDYVYNIKANIISEYKTDEKGNNVSNPIWNKEFILVDSKSGIAKDSQIKLNENLNIGLKIYNDWLQSFDSKLSIPSTSRLEIKFTIMINGKLSNNKDIKKEHYMLMTIPLGVKAFDITTSKNFLEQEITYSKEPPKAELSYMMAIIYIIVLLLILFAGYYFIRRITDKKKNKYYEEIKKILKDYDERIVTVSNFIKYEKLEVVNIPNFDELLKLSDETLEPIIYWKRRGIGLNEAWFSILRNRVLYRYVVTYKNRETTNKEVKDNNLKQTSSDLENKNAKIKNID